MKAMNSQYISFDLDIALYLVNRTTTAVLFNFIDKNFKPVTGVTGPRSLQQVFMHSLSRIKTIQCQLEREI
jgi:hypothetical protein